MDVIDLNADLGETVDGVPTADDEALFPLISSANVACGGHAGDSASMADAVRRAHEHGVAVGAHPSYPDRARFGRAVVAMDAGDLRESLVQQLAALAGVGADIRYVKPHGALYHAVRTDAAHAAALADAVAALSDRSGRAVPILGMTGVIAREAHGRGLGFLSEAFLDRGYRADGSLVPREEPGALLTDPAATAARAVRLSREAVVVAIDGSLVTVDAASLCLHADSPGSVESAVAVRAALDAASVLVRAPW